MHRSYDALQYPIMFCYGEDGYSLSLPQDKQNHIFHCRSLLSQFLVDIYAKIETERLNFIRNNQKTLRAESYIHLKDAIDKNDADIRQLGQAVILPSSFTGGPRYMHKRTQDAMTYGRPDLFITFTCNPKWTEITEALLPRQKPQHRHDITSRVFHLKVKKIMSLLPKGSLFGKPRCYMYSVEWQKRVLPHIHILLWLENAITPDRIDNIICAEIPNPKEDPILYNIVKRNMIHGPCGNFNTHSQCIKDGKCSKRYPKPFLNETQTGDDGYPKYRRRSPSEGGFTVTIEKAQGTWVLDNSWGVPFNPVLLRTFNAHINVEYCNSVKSIKYICKSMNKGRDQATLAVENECDEINIYQTGRYISSSEAKKIDLFEENKEHALSTLILLEDIILSLGGRTLQEYSLPEAIRTDDILENREYLKQINYDVAILKDTVAKHEACLTDDQKTVYHKVLQSVGSNSNKVFFLDASGGTGKTYLINLLLAKVRSTKNIAIAGASSGIAATLLQGGKTSHITFKLPLHLNRVEAPVCSISKQSDLASVLQDCKLIVWDECTMSHKAGIEAVDRTLRDLRNSSKLMGGVTVLFSGDFRQTLPVMPRGTRADEVNACLKSSFLWPKVEKLSLSTNMRVHLRGDINADLLLKIGNGDLNNIHSILKIPPNLCTTIDSVDSLIAEIYPDIKHLRQKPASWLRERALLTPTNASASELNHCLLERLGGSETVYKSIDSVLNSDDAVNYPVEFLNTLEPPGMPAHRLTLKVGAARNASSPPYSQGWSHQECQLTALLSRLEPPGMPAHRLTLKVGAARYVSSSPYSQGWSRQECQLTALLSRLEPPGMPAHRLTLKVGAARNACSPPYSQGWSRQECLLTVLLSRLEPPGMLAHRLTLKVGAARNASSPPYSQGWSRQECLLTVLLSRLEPPGMLAHRLTLKVGAARNASSPPYSQGWSRQECQLTALLSRLEPPGMLAHRLTLKVGAARNASSPPYSQGWSRQECLLTILLSRLEPPGMLAHRLTLKVGAARNASSPSYSQGWSRQECQLTALLSRLEPPGMLAHRLTLKVGAARNASSPPYSQGWSRQECQLTVLLSRLEPPGMPAHRLTLKVGAARNASSPPYSQGWSRQEC
ncbi:uncharacterized protein [Eleutherodactylus coqui]|uniref:uncharacterized protein n=1 Tax=Eleutherodactylus coqui TaxID=57060 RepID=UPI00346196BC